MRSSLAALAAALLVTASPGAARADDKAECVASYDKAQALRKENKLRAARQELVVCTRDACPRLVRQDCSKWMDEVTANLPSLVFAARDASGKDRTDVRVLVDGEAVKEELGQEVVVDPGVHTVRFEAADATPIEQQVVVPVGEKRRVIAVTLQPPQEAAPPPVPVVEPPKPPPEKPRPASRPMPVLVPVLGAVGVVAIGAGAYLGVSANSTLGDLRNTCAPHCVQSDVDKVNLRFGVAAASLGVGVVAVGAAVWLYVRRPEATERVGLTGFGVSPSGATLRGRF